MALREDTERGVRHERDQWHERHGRHGRRKPFGGRLRLPTLRFSGAAMAMSTVVGISIATTYLLNEQQGVGRRAGVARVGSSPPPPSPAPDQAATGQAAADQSTTDQAHGAADRTPAAPSSRRPSAGPSGTASPSVSTAPRPDAPRPGPYEAGSPSPGTHDADTHGKGTGTPGAAVHGPLAAPSDTGQGAFADPSAEALGPVRERPTAPPAGPAAEPPATPRPFTKSSPAPAAPDSRSTDEDPADPSVPDDPVEPADPADPADDGATDAALTGRALVQPVGRDGLRHLLSLTVAEPLTALQAEFRLAPGELAPGTGTAWTDLPGTVVTAHQERGVLVYRFTTPAGTDVRPGHYTFGVRGTRPAAAPERTAGPEHRAAGSRSTESWNAAAFGIHRPRAVAALGTFTAPSR
ncbi:hypothetical protein [Kitasatospora sp. NPDC092286]|uniref:hypothetical protein n=1 Tax=Kitasatospora sp. NPDC092286 TaxID=3364087 RepID=UPI0038224C0B